MTPEATPDYPALTVDPRSETIPLKVRPGMPGADPPPPTIAPLNNPRLLGVELCRQIAEANDKDAVIVVHIKDGHMGYHTWGKAQPWSMIAEDVADKLMAHVGPFLRYMGWAKNLFASEVRAAEKAARRKAERGR